MAGADLDIKINVENADFNAFVARLADVSMRQEDMETPGDPADVTRLIAAFTAFRNELVTLDFVHFESASGPDCLCLFATPSPFAVAILQLTESLPAVILARRAAGKAGAP